MDKKRNTQPKDWREARRLQGWKLYQKGWKQTDIAEALDVSEGAVSQWIKKAKSLGVGKPVSSQGRWSQATSEPSPKSHQLPQLLSQGAEAYGFRGDVWTRGRVGKVIQQVFGVTFSLGHIGRILKQIGWTRQKPITRASQRDEQAIERWRTEKWLELEKKPSKKDEPSCL